MKNPRNIVITGASSGIGEALAHYYAAPGITLHLNGRNKERLHQVAKICEGVGAAVNMHAGDVTDAAAIKTWLEAADAISPIDLVIANAGISAGTGFQGESSEQARKVFAVNIDGVMNTVQPLLPAMIARQKGQIAIVSSLAGFRGLPSSPAYSASKACVRVYGEGLRGWLQQHRVEVSVICPGWVRTALVTGNTFPMPLIMDAEKAARIIARGLAVNKSRIAFPGLIYWPLWFLTCLPACWTDPLFASLPTKQSASEL
jgi:NADP-dependent 3-hydroxy acid dehydrogenase YdfG